MLTQVINRLRFGAPLLVDVGAQPYVAARSSASGQEGVGGLRRATASWMRQQRLRLLFVTDRREGVEACLDELTRSHMLVTSKTARAEAEFMALFSWGDYDAVVCSDRLLEWTGSRALDLVREVDPAIPFIVVREDDETDAAEWLARGATDCVDAGALHLLPMAVALAVKERSLRDEQRRAHEELQRSRAFYRALCENPTYGICRFDVGGRFLEVNDTLARMLGYGSRQQLMAANLKTHILRHDETWDVLLESSSRTGGVDGLQMAWTRKDGQPIQVRLGGRQVSAEAERFHGWELIVENVTEQCALETRLRQLATTDPLTGLANYRQLTESIEAEIRRSERSERSFVVLLCDLDKMKEINDQHGHAAGNRALCRLAGVLRRSSRRIDLVARCGGDEFLLVLPEATVEEAQVVKGRILERLARDTESPSLSLSVGSAVYPHDGATLEALLQCADEELYGMKRSNRGAVGAHARGDRERGRMLG